MKKAIWKSTIREIRQSFGRYLAILAIVALGVGFFAGLKVTKPFMVETTRQYLEEKQFYDYRLLSALGFEQEDVDFLAGQEEVRAAEGALSFDILGSGIDGIETVFKFHSLTEEINGVELVEGRLPERADECVVDSNLYGREAIGQKIVFSGENDSDDLEHFAYREYTVVGIVQSSYYIQFERGNTSLGNGRVAGFAYIMPEGFDTDYYTEIFIKFNADFPLFGDEYRDYMEEKKQVWEPLTESAAMRRYDSLMADANEELENARRELADKKKEAEEELADARQELDDAARELADGRDKIVSAKRELADGEKTLREKEQELADAEQTIAEEEKKLADGEKELEDSIDTWHEENDKVEGAKSGLEGNRRELDAQIAELDAQTAGVAQARQQLAEQEEALNAQEAGLNQTAAFLDAWEEQLKLLNGGTVPEAERAQIDAGRAELAAGAEQLAGARVQIQTAKEQADAGELKIQEGRTVIAAYQAQLEEGARALAGADRELDKAWMQILAGQRELEDGRQKLTDARAKLEDGRSRLEDGRQELLDGKKELAEKELELLDGEQEYKDGEQEYEEGYKDFQQEITDAEGKLSDAEQEIADVEAPDTYVLGRETNVGYVCFESDSDIVEGISNIFPIFFFLVAALVCITTMNRMVEEQRTQIGVLKALGYSRGVIMTKYLFYSGSAALIGCVAGFLGGTYLFPQVIWAAYGIMYNVSGLVYLFDWKLAVISLICSLLCSMGTTWLSCRYELTEVAAELMRPKSPKAGKRVLLEHVAFIWKRMKFLQKVSFRNIFRYKKRFFMMIIGISGCTALLVTGFGIKDSIANVAGQQYSEIQIYEVSLTFNSPAGESKEEALSGLGLDAAQYTFVKEKSVELLSEEKVKSINMVITDAGVDISPFLNLHTMQKEAIAFPGKGEAVLSQKIAEEFGIRTGDRILLRDDDMHTMEVTVTGINQNFIYNYVYINSDTYRDCLGEEPEYETAYINLAPDTDAHAFAASAMKLDGVAAVTINGDVKDRFDNMMRSLDLIVLVVIVCAAGLAFIVFYNLTNINITERVREIATIKVLGFYRKETASYVFRENMVLTLLGSGVGLVLGYLLHLFVMNEIRVDMVAFDIRVKPVSYLYSVALTFAFAWFVNKMMGKKLENISMTESLKSVD